MPKLLAYRLTEKFVFGKTGVDVRFRLLVDGDLEKRSITRHTPEGKALFLSILPLEFGNPSPVIAGWLTIVLALAFVALSPEPIRAIMLQSPTKQHLVPLALAWAATYVLGSLAGAVLACGYALIAYSRRAAKVNFIASKHGPNLET